MKGKGKRPHVIVAAPNTSHVHNLSLQKTIPVAAGITTDKRKSRRNSEKQDGGREVGQNQAAAEESHWVVNGSTKHNFIQ